MELFYIVAMVMKVLAAGQAMAVGQPQRVERHELAEVLRERALT